MKAQKLNQKQVRWALYLFRFSFMLKHVLGSKMGKANSLSRRLDWEIGVEKDNEDETLVKPEQLKAERMEVVEEIKQVGVKMLRDKEQREFNGIMYKERKVYIPKDKKLRAEIIWLYHDTLVEEHSEQWKIVELVTQNFWWPGITKEVKQYVKGCDAYQ